MPAEGSFNEPSGHQQVGGKVIGNRLDPALLQIDVALTELGVVERHVWMTNYMKQLVCTSKSTVRMRVITVNKQQIAPILTSRHAAHTFV